MAAIATGAMGTLLPKLAILLNEEYNLQKGVRTGIKFLEAELESIQAALLKVSEVPIDQPPDVQVMQWAREVRELSYDIEDKVDTFMIRIDSCDQRKDNGFRGFIKKILKLLMKAKFRHKIGVDIIDIKRRINEVSERRHRYKIDNIPAKPIGQSVSNLRLSALYRNSIELIGTEEKSQELVNILMEVNEGSSGHQQLKIVSIVGFGGLGKTTLAMVVYEKLKIQFDCSAFVSVSPNPNFINIFKNMLHQLGNYNYEATWDESQLINELREFLRNKRYFIVIDDIWDISAWKTIRYSLVENKLGDKIITTTRILDVAKQVGVVYQLEHLSPLYSRNLFYLKIFGIEDKSPPHELTEVSENILKKCGGVPLAIITIASMLASKKEHESAQKYWSKVCETMGAGLEDNPDIRDMRWILSISYHDLPLHLKSCLLYLCSYPEEDAIVTEDMIWKRIGEGFIVKQQGKTMYEVGEEYFNELINRSLIQPIHDNSGRNVTSCRLHDMILDLIAWLSNENNLITTFGFQRRYVPDKIRRLSLQACVEEDVQTLSAINLSHVRSLTVSTESFRLLPALSNFPALRVLDLSGCRQVDDHHSEKICKLFHLRYLMLRLTSITHIPKSIGNLQFLQVLDFRGTGINDLPSTFVQLQQLLCVHFDYLDRTPDGFGNMKSLQNLAGTINVLSPTMLHDWDGMTKLTHVNMCFRGGPSNSKEQETFIRCLSNLVSLEHLEIDSYFGDFGSKSDRLSPGPQQLRNIHIRRSRIFTVPRWMSTLSALSILHISLLETLGEVDLQVLGSIPSLSILVIRMENRQGRGRHLVIGDDCRFLSLTKFDISNTTGVVFARGAMPKLHNLELRFEVRETIDECGSINFGLENLSSLQHVNVWMICSLANAKELKAAELAFQESCNMNPNNPTLHLEKVLHGYL